MDPFLEGPAHWRDFHRTFINYWREAIADLLPEHYHARLSEHVVLEPMPGDADMPSPFPGMDPFLEGPAHWRDFHQTFVNYWREAIADLLPEHYHARLDERVVLEGPDDDEPFKVISPDITVARDTKRRKPKKGGVAVIEVAKPVRMTLAMPQYIKTRQGFIEIIKLPEQKLITVLELLSPSNKSGNDRSAYQRKRNRLIRGPVHLVELDLLRNGRRLPMREALPSGDYFAFVSRGDHRPECEAYPWSIRDRLPAIPVPLRTPDPDIVVDLAGIFATAYERGRYGQIVRYDRDLPVAIDPENRAWIEQTVRMPPPG